MKHVGTRILSIYFWRRSSCLRTITWKLEKVSIKYEKELIRSFLINCALQIIYFKIYNIVNVTNKYIISKITLCNKTIILIINQFFVNCLVGKLMFYEIFLVKQSVLSFLLAKILTNQVTPFIILIFQVWKKSYLSSYQCILTNI